MPIHLTRRRLLQAAGLLPLGACAGGRRRALRLESASLSADGQHLHCVVTLELTQRVSRYPRDYDEVLSQQILALELPARPGLFATEDLLRQARPLAGPDPQQLSGRFWLWQGHLLEAREQEFHWCRLEAEGSCAPLGRTAGPGPDALFQPNRWLLGDEGRYVLTPTLRVDLSQAQTQHQGWAERPGYRAFAEALQARAPLAAPREHPEFGYDLSLVEGRWLLALLRPRARSGLRRWAYAYDLQHDRMSAWSRAPWAGCERLEARQAARGEQGWWLWLRPSTTGISSQDCDPADPVDAVLDLAANRLYPLLVPRYRIHGAWAKLWDPARRRIVLVEADPRHGKELPQRLLVDELRY